MSGKNYTFGDYVLDTRKRELSLRSRSIEISVKAFDILEFLVENRDKTVTKEELFDSIWSDSFVEESNLPVHISALRRSLGEKRGESKYIKTIFGSGYKFIAEVEEIGASAEKDERTDGKDEFGDLNFVKTNSDSIAVLPFASLDDDPEIEYLAEGLTQDLINHFAQFSELKVMAFSAVKNYRNSKLDFPEIGFQMNVDRIFNGTIKKFKDKLDVYVELINTKDRSILWGSRYSRNFDDIFSVKEEISEKVLEILEIGKDENGSSGNKQTQVDAETYNLYLKGLYILTNFANSEDRRKSLESALKVFRQAVKSDPSFAPSYVAIGKIHFFQYNNDYISKADAIALCRTAFQRAVACDPNLSEAYVLEGMIKMFFESDFVAADECFKKALKLNPNDAYAYHVQSLLFVVLGKFDKAFEAQNKAILLDPTSTSYNCGLLNRFFFNGNFNRAITHAEETIEMNERAVPAYLILALSYAMLGVYDEALKAIRKAQEFSLLPDYLLTESYILALDGDEKTARKILTEVSADKSTAELFYSDIAVVLVALGEEEKAIEIVEKSCSNGYIMNYLLQFDPRMQHLKENPRYLSILQDIHNHGNFPGL